jgi:hypothetical protein
MASVPDSQPEAKSFAQRRRDRRRPVLYRAELFVLGKPSIRCTVLDLTDGGAKVQVNKPVFEGQLVKLMSRRLTRNARVAWTVADLVGLEFTGSRLDIAKSLDAPA